MGRRLTDLVPCDEAAARRVAAIIGDGSAASQALARLAEIRAAGGAATLMHSRSLRSFFVVTGNAPGTHDCQTEGR